MDDQYVIGPDASGVVTLMDTESGIVVEQGDYSITIPSATQQGAAPSQSVVYTSQPPGIQPRVVYSTQPHQVMYPVAAAHPQVVYAGGTVQQHVPIVTQHQQVLIQQQHVPQDLIQVQQQQQQHQQSSVLITSQGQRVRPHFVTTQQQLQSKNYQLQLQSHQVQQQQVQQQIQQQQLVAQTATPLAQQLTHTPVLQASQQTQSGTGRFVDQKFTDGKGIVHIMRTPLTSGGIRQPVNTAVGQQIVAQPTIAQHTVQQVPTVIGAVRAATPQPTAGQVQRFHRNVPVHRQPNQVVQSQEEQQPSYQEQYLKQLENKYSATQKGVTRTKTNKTTAAQQRRLVSQQLGNVPPQQQQQPRKHQVVGATVGHTIISRPGIVSAAASEQQPQQQQQEQQEIHIQNASPSKKLSLNEYRIRQQGNVSSPTTTKQFAYIQTDGKKYFCPVDTLDMTSNLTGPATTISATISNPKANAANSSLLIIKEGEAVRLNLSPVQASSSSLMSSPAPSPSPSKVVSSGESTTSTPPIQEQTVHSTALVEQPEKDPNDQPRFIPGSAALCSNCGYTSDDINRCERCNVKLPPTVKILSSVSSSCVSTVAKNKTSDSPGIGRGTTMITTHFYKQEFHGKTGGGLKKGVEKKSSASPAQKPKGKGRGRGRAFEEPEIVSISSDEDDERPPSSGSSAGLRDSDGNLQGRFHRTACKEPIITTDMENFEDFEEQDSGGAVFGGGLPEQQSEPESTCKGMYLSIQARSVRVGTYKVMPTERVLIVPQGFRLKIPALKSTSTETIDIPLKSIVKILAHFGKSLPVMFLYLKPSVAEKIRKQLKMSDKKGLYYDPCSAEEGQKRIIILPDKLKDEEKLKIKEILSTTGNSLKDKTKLEDLSLQEANEILIKSLPSDVKNIVPKEPVKMETKTLLIYPPPPQKGGISITTDDYACLEEEQFLNDVIIDFYLKYLLQKKLSEEHRKRTHVFSTFFYKRLTFKHKPGRRFSAIEDDPKLTPAEKRHARVKSWTKNVDIFEKDFIIIPINEHAHWFLAIICYPGLDGPVHNSDGTPLLSHSAPERPRKRRSTRPKARIEMTIDDGETSDRDEASGDSDELEDDDDDEDPPPSKKTRVEGDTHNCQSKADQNAPSIKQPCILIFDSLSGANRVRIVATLRDYLTVEHKVRKHSEKIFNRDTMKGACPRVPQQMNYSDCGIYTLQFAETFFEEPLKDYTFPIRTLSDWFPQEKVRCKREAIAALIRKLMVDHNPNHSSISLPDIFSSEDKKESGSNEALSSSSGVSENQIQNTNQTEEEIPFFEHKLEEKFDASNCNKESSNADESLKCHSSNTYHVHVSSKCSSSSEVYGSCTFSNNSQSREEQSRQCISANSSGPTKGILDKSSESLRKSVPMNRVSQNAVCGGEGQAKNVQLVKAASMGVQELPSSGVNSSKDQLDYESDDAIFPNRSSKKKVTMKGSVSSVTGLGFLQSSYCDDEFENSPIENSSKVIRSVSNMPVRKLTNTTGAMKVERVVYMPEKNGVSEQVISQVKGAKKITVCVENKNKVVNGTVETVPRGSQIVQVVPNTQTVHTAVIGEKSREIHSHMQSTANISTMSRQNMSFVNPPTYSYQNVSCSKASTSSSNVRSVSQYVSASQSHEVLKSSAVPVNSASSSIDRDSGVKTVESSGMTSIIDEDTDEVLLIMQASNSISEQSKCNNRVNKDINEQLFMQEEGNAAQLTVGRLTSSSTHNPDGQPCIRHTCTMSPPQRAGSSSPTCIGGSPTVLRTSDRITSVTSSGRTIARPKRFDDSYEDDIFPSKKSRSKHVPGKPRTLR